jgi:hypothetical protein
VKNVEEQERSKVREASTLMDKEGFGPSSQSLIFGRFLVEKRLGEEFLKYVQKVLFAMSPPTKFRRDVVKGLGVPAEYVLPDEELTEEERARNKP